MARSAPARAPSSGPRVSGARPSGGYRGPSAAPRGSSGYRGPSNAYRGGGAYARPGGSGYAVPRHPYNGYGSGHYYGNRYGHYPYYGNRYGYGRYYGRGHYPYYGYGHYYRPYYGYYPYYSWGFYYGYPYYWGAYYGYPYWGAYWGWPYGSVGFSYYGGGGDYDASDYQGAARLEVKPRQTEVFVDGYYAGVVDDFDGFKRLRLEPGEHDVTLYLDGYRPLSRRMLFTQGQTFRVEHQMEPLAAGEPMPPRPAPTAKPAPPQRDPGSGNGNGAYGRTNGSGSYRPAMRISDGAAPEAGEPARPTTDVEIVDPSRTPGGPSGTLSVRVQPEDAEILVDGEPWARSGGDRLVVTLGPGVHKLEIRKPGFETYSGLVRVRPGAGTTLNVALAPEEKR